MNKADDLRIYFSEKPSAKIESKLVSHCFAKKCFRNVIVLGYLYRAIDRLSDIRTLQRSTLSFYISCTRVRVLLGKNCAAYREICSAHLLHVRPRFT